MEMKIQRNHNSYIKLIIFCVKNLSFMKKEEKKIKKSFLKKFLKLRIKKILEKN